MEFKIFLFSICFLIDISVGSSLQNNEQCFITGGCTESIPVEIVSAGDGYQCLDACKAEDECYWFTFYANSKTCALFKNCTSVDVEACDNCFSGEKDCTSEEPTCWIEGQCEGNLIAETEAETSGECLRFCKGENRCRWFTFFTPGKSCFIFSDCSTFDETTDGCISGEQRCEEEIETTTSPTTTLPPPTTTTMPPTIYSKVLIANGVNGSFLNDVEVIDLLSPDFTCRKFPPFPVPQGYQAGGLDSKGRPLICGGTAGDQTSCYLFEAGDWIEGKPLNQNRSGHAITTSPFQDGERQLIAIGGSDGMSAWSTTELLTDRGWEYSTNLPTGLFFHCVVKLNSTSLMVIGGSPVTGRTLIFNSESGIWTEGPSLATPRCGHGCGLIAPSGKGDNEKSIVVAGGYDGGITIYNSVEILDAGSGKWRRGPDLPIAVFGTSMVEDPSGGVVLIGGLARREFHGELFMLANAEAEWEMMNQRLETPRSWHSAFLVPDEIVVCN